MTGLIMEKGGIYEVRVTHRLVSIPFVVVLGGMTVTGLFMWVIPKILGGRQSGKA
ncbi:MAG: hypothetical protein ABII21_04080 [bacterium]